MICFFFYSYRYFRDLKEVIPLTNRLTDSDDFDLIISIYASLLNLDKETLKADVLNGAYDDGESFTVIHDFYNVKATI